MVYPICTTFCMKTQNPSTMTVERQKFLILIIQDGGLIRTKTLRTQMLLLGTSLLRLIVSTDRGDTLVLNVLTF